MPDTKQIIELLNSLDILQRDAAREECDHTSARILIASEIERLRIETVEKERDELVELLTGLLKRDEISTGNMPENEYKIFDKWSSIIEEYK